MKYLHDKKDLFLDILEECSYETGISKAIIEKDYYVTLLLKEIVERCFDIIFKGGTSLSKCYGIINRFSEDIDLGLDTSKATQGMKKRLKSCIIEAITALNIDIVFISTIKLTNQHLNLSFFRIKRYNKQKKSPDIFYQGSFCLTYNTFCK